MKKCYTTQTKVYKNTLAFNKRRQAVKSYMLFENLRDREDWWASTTQSIMDASDVVIQLHWRLSPPLNPIISLNTKPNYLISTYLDFQVCVITNAQQAID